MADRPIAAKVGLVGVASSGKTSLFCALTGTEYARAVANTGKAVGASVRILDPRLEKIHQIEGSHKKLVTPVVEVVDAQSIALEGGEKADNPGKLSAVREADGFLVVLKGYEGEDVQKQLDTIRSEFLLADLDVMQKRIEKLKGDTKKSLPNRDELLKELSVLEPLLEAVSGGDTGAFAKLSPEDEKRLKGFQFYSKKPLIPVANIGETQLGKAPPGGDVLPCAVKLEMELLAMEPAERASFMKDYGLDSLVLERLAVTVFQRLGMQTFITTGDKDVTAWHLRKGATALDAAGRIHTDLAKGFINCEVVSYAEYQKWKNYREAQSRSNKRVEGKAYVMQDYDFIEVKSGV
jgi:ribosome-binding ATPase YchF (GTP1/OBG family)